MTHHAMNVKGMQYYRARNARRRSALLASPLGFLLHVLAFYSKQLCPEQELGISVGHVEHVI